MCHVLVLSSIPRPSLMGHSLHSHCNCIDLGILYTVEHDFTADQPGQLSIKKGEELNIYSRNEKVDWYKVVNSKGEVGLVPMSSISMVSNLEIHPWFHGNITRVETELTLRSEVNGSFLVRNSESKPGKYVISLHHEGSTSHYIINMDPLTSRYYFNVPQLSFQSLPKLIAHHSKISDGLVTTLRYPAFHPRKTPISSNFIYSREVDEWEVNRSDIKTGQILHKKKYAEIYKASFKNISLSIKITRVSYKKNELESYNYDIMILGGGCRCLY